MTKKPHRPKPAKSAPIIKPSEGLPVKTGQAAPAFGPSPWRWAGLALLLFAVGAWLSSAPGDLSEGLGRWASFWDRPLIEGGQTLHWLFVIEPFRVLGLYMQLGALGLLLWAWWKGSPAQSGPLALRGLATAAELAVAIALLHFLAAYLIIALRRIGYVYELEWGEGAQLDVVRRAMQGKTLYPEPSLDFTGGIYGPLYFWLGALVAKVWGLGFGCLRGISFAATLGSFALLFHWVKRETGRLLPAIIAAGFYAACFGFAGFWYEVGRVDALCLFLTLAGAYRLRWAVSGRDHAIAGLLFVLSVLTKQSAGVMMGCMSLFLLTRGRRAFGIYIAVTAAVGLGVALILHLGSHGWSTYYLFKLTSNFRVAGADTLTLWAHLKKDIPFAMLVSLGALAVLWGDKLQRQRAIFYSALFFSALWTVHLGVTLKGAYLNHYMLIDAITGLMLGLALGLAQDGPWPKAAAPVARLAMSLALLLQVPRCLYDPSTAVPAPFARQGWDKLIKDIQAVDGEVLVPFTGYLPTLAGKTTHSFVMNMDSIMLFLPGEDPVKRRLGAEITEKIRSQQFGAIITDGYGWTAFDAFLNDVYEPHDYQFVGQAPVVGWHITPNKWFSPKKKAASAEKGKP